MKIAENPPALMDRAPTQHENSGKSTSPTIALMWLKDK
jgi:hypothetical protein